jgi:hypothetical protein
MAKQIQLRRGTEAENNAFTGALAELTVDTTNKALRLHDGVTAGGVALVNNATNQTIAGIKTFTSSPTVPVPTADFQPVPLKSTNITVDVGAGQTYTTINQALEYLSGFYPMYKQSGITATINLKAGFVMAEQVLVSGIDLGWITIIGDDTETTIDHTALTTAFEGQYPAFGVNRGGTLPVIGQMFRFNAKAVGGDKHGIFTFGAESSANILNGCGVADAGTYGIVATNGSTVNAYSANCSGAGTYGIVAINGSTVNAYSANCSGAGTHGIRAANGSTVNAYSANCSGAGAYGIYSTSGSTVNAIYADCSGAGGYGIRVLEGSIVSAYAATGTLSQTANTPTALGIIFQ